MYVRRRTDFVELEGENCPFDFNHQRTLNMLYTIAVVLLILWLLGLVTSVTMGGLIHVLLVIAIVVVLLRVISGRSPI